MTPWISNTRAARTLGQAASGGRGAGNQAAEAVYREVIAPYEAGLEPSYLGHQSSWLKLRIISATTLAVLSPGVDAHPAPMVPGTAAYHERPCDHGCWRVEYVDVNWAGPCCRSDVSFATFIGYVLRYDRPCTSCRRKQRLERNGQYAAASDLKATRLRNWDHSKSCVERPQRLCFALPVQPLNDGDPSASTHRST